MHTMNNSERLFPLRDSDSRSIELVHEDEKARLAGVDSLIFLLLEGMKLTLEVELAVVLVIFRTSVDGDDGGPYFFGRLETLDLINVAPLEADKDKLPCLGILLKLGVVVSIHQRAICDLGDFFITKE